MFSEHACSKSLRTYGLIALAALACSGCNQSGNPSGVEQQQIGQQIDTIERASAGPIAAQPPDRQTTADHRPRAANSQSPDADEAAVVDSVQTDPADVRERILLLPPHGPFVIELRVTLDGHPLREPREELVSEMLQLADRNHDGRSTWGEAFADPKRIFGLLRTDAFHLGSRRDFMKANDTNRNGLIDRDEARRFVAAVKASGAALSIENAADFYASDPRRSIVRKLLDADGDGALDRGEIMALERRLLSRDANNDRTITWSELDDTLAGDELAAERKKWKHRAEPTARLLGPEANGDDDLEPDAAIAVAFQGSERSRAVSRLSLERFSARLVRIDTPALDQVVLDSPSKRSRIRFVLDNRGAGEGPWLTGVYAVVLCEQDAVFSLLDTNHDGRLTTRELRGGSGALDHFDADGDHRLTAEEIPETLVIVLGRGQPPEQPLLAGQITPSGGGDLAPEWFTSMDANGDLEIDRDEFPGRDERFRSLDSDHDGFVTREEALQAELFFGRPE